ncbi:hypothetical protein J7T55_009017 [Diaporthe amygdali]|uniref:uncharacterized protein n=1 Tax=Phomopsis amygdali TaxID=1214568 RepID=UPI0022FEA704|nr:uncharacterized protein J7T55_009017 [Diaporthe amygdali]KAJ0118234.1 hypothetical protein J7T55_009017 [Diaporthe amygdali]
MADRVTSRSTCVTAAANHVVKQKPSDLTDQQKENLQDALLGAKKMLQGPDCPEPTPKEFDRFLSVVFGMWMSRQYHVLPEANSLTTGMGDKTVPVGRLDKEVATSKEVNEESKRRQGAVTGKVTKTRGSKQTISPYEVRTAHRDRMRGAQVLIRASLKNGSKVTTQFVTQSGGFLSSTVPMTYLAGMSEVKAYYESFRQFDQYEVTRVNHYNLAIAVFIARNRITTWANGALPSTRPIEEPFGLLRPINTIRDKAVTFEKNKMKDACDMLKQLPAYNLYPGIPTEDHFDAPQHNVGA